MELEWEKCIRNNLQIMELVLKSINKTILLQQLAIFVTYTKVSFLNLFYVQQSTASLNPLIRLPG